MLASFVLQAYAATAYAANDGLAASATRANGIMDMVAQAGPMVKTILLGLLLMSLACWAIIFIKMRLFRKVQNESLQFMDLYWHRKSFPNLYRDSKAFAESSLVQIFQIGYEELTRVSKFLDRSSEETRGQSEALADNVERAMRGAILAESQRLERFLPVLATTGNTAPFIGLFGTVWGIMTSFQEIGLKGAANLAVVAPGISEALIATAIGLATAIPAVVAYNHFATKMRQIDNEMQNFAADFLNIIKRDLLRRQTTKPEAMALSKGATAEQRSEVGYQRSDVGDQRPEA